MSACTARNSGPGSPIEIRSLGGHVAKAPSQWKRRTREPLRLDCHVPVEVAETEWPIVVERYGLIPRAFTAMRSTTPSQPGLRLAQGMYV